uniref:Ovule protein n=1 Tax=Heterorhabditis bacteriophora TaxID=37862 RepID=A0A1I7W745_HETBA
MTYQQCIMIHNEKDKEERKKKQMKKYIRPCLVYVAAELKILMYLSLLKSQYIKHKTTNQVANCFFNPLGIGCRFCDLL